MRWWRGCRLLAVLALLARVTFVATATPVPKAVSTGEAVAADLPVPHYRNILVPLDHSAHDRAAIAHAVAMARSHGATLHLLHVEEGVTSQLFGALSSTEEIISGEEYFGGDRAVSRGVGDCGGFDAFSMGSRRPTRLCARPARFSRI